MRTSLRVLAGLVGCAALAGCSSPEAESVSSTTAAALPSDEASLDNAGVACVDALKARYPADSSPLLRDYTTVVEGDNYTTRGYVDVVVGGADGVERYRIVCTTTASGDDYSSTVSESERVPYTVEPEPSRAPQPPRTGARVDARDAEIAFRAGLIRIDFPGRDDPDLIRRAKNICRQLDAGDSLTAVGEALQERNPGWSTRQAGQFTGVAIGAFCQEHRGLLPG